MELSIWLWWYRRTRPSRFWTFISW